MKDLKTSLIEHLRRLASAAFLIAMGVLSSASSLQDMSEPCGMRSAPPPPPTPDEINAAIFHGGAIKMGMTGLVQDAAFNAMKPLRSPLSQRSHPEAILSNYRLGMRILVLSATKNAQREPALALIRETLDGHGIPYIQKHLTRNGARISDAPLELKCPGENACGLYYGIVLTSDLLAYQDPAGNWASALTPAQWHQLEEYEAKHGVRRVAIAAYPRETYGVRPASDPVTAENELEMLPASTPFSSGIKERAILPLSGSFQNPASIIDPSKVTPLATFRLAPSAGTTAIAVTNFENGRQQLNFYFAQSVFLLASRYTSILWVNWLTHGIYLGKRRIYLNLQVDDLFMPNAMWSMVRMAPTDDGNGTYRATPDDLDELVRWQAEVRQRMGPGSTFMVEMAVNGIGVWESGDYAVDSLFQRARQYLDEFHWVNHTFSHPDLDAVSFRRMSHETRSNQQFLSDLTGGDHPNFSPHSLVTPHISGIFNKNALRALYESGIRNVVGDNSRRELWPDQPYHGYYTAAEPNGFDGIFVIPRQATVAPVSSGPITYLTSFYNTLYKSYWGKELNPTEILTLEAQRVARLLLAFRHDPYMFHQGNIWMFNWTEHPGATGRKRHSLVSLWTEFVLAEIRNYTTLPVLSARMDDMAKMLQDRMERDACNPSATMTISDGSITQLALETAFSCQIPVTGLQPSTSGANLESYGPDTTWLIHAGGQESSDMEVRKVGWN